MFQVEGKYNKNVYQLTLTRLRTTMQQNSFMMILVLRAQVFKSERYNKINYQHKLKQMQLPAKNKKKNKMCYAYSN